MSPPLTVVTGGSPLLLIAPHAGRRDGVRRPWSSGGLKMNDLHTGSLTHDLARALDASAIVNDASDRNDVDLNRIADACANAPAFLRALGDALDGILARHPRAIVLTIHGWNVVQPAVDVGVGDRPSPATLRGGDPTAISEGFATSTLPRLAAALHARGLAVTPGVRYPARARENLLQLFTTRHREDPREAVRRLAALASRVDAAQLELSVPVRAPGPWREAFVAACTEALGSADGAVDAGWPPWEPVPGDAPVRAGLELVAPGVSGLVALDEHGGRLLLFRDDGRLVTFTGERIGRHPAGTVAGLALVPHDDGALAVRYRGPMLAFPDTTPFLDLEMGLARATVLDAEVTLDYRPSHLEGEVACPAGYVVGDVRLGGEHLRVEGAGHRAVRGVPGNARVSLRLGHGGALIARGGTGILCRDGRHTTVEDVGVERTDDECVRITGRAQDGATIDVTADLVHRLPVVFGAAGGARVLFASCRIGTRLAGWIEVPGA